MSSRQSDFDSTIGEPLQITGNVAPRDPVGCAGGAQVRNTNDASVSHGYSGSYWKANQQWFPQRRRYVAMGSHIFCCCVNCRGFRVSGDRVSRGWCREDFVFSLFDFVLNIPCGGIEAPSVNYSRRKRFEGMVTRNIMTRSGALELRPFNPGEMG